MKLKLIGSWAFLIGVVLALVVGIVAGSGKVELMTPAITWVLVALGIIIGLLNISGKENSGFLMSGIIMILASIFGANLMSAAPQVSSILIALMMLFVPAVIVVATKNVFNIAKN